MEDIVKCDVRGKIFFAEVRELGIKTTVTHTGIRVKPITPNVTYTIIAANQIIGHYRKARGSR